MAGFFFLMVAIVAALHLYIAMRLLPKPRRQRRNRKWRVLIAISAISIPLSFLRGRYLDPGLLSTSIAWTGYVSLGLLGILTGLVFFRDLFLTAARFAPKGTDPARREFLRRATAVGVLGAGGAIAVEGIVGAARPPSVERVPVRIDGLPQALEGFTIAQISDTHLGPTIGRDFLEHVVERTNALGADVIAFTGDLADGFVGDMRSHVEPLKELRAKHGVYFVTGNHEYYWRGDQWIDRVQDLGLTVLVNQHRLIDIGGSSIAIGGVPDVRESTRYADYGSSPKRAFRGAESADVKVLLAHRPKSLYGAQEAGVDLQLCGHTHGGQVFPMNLIVHLAHPVVAGLKRFGKTWVYVNRGTAYWGPPMRTLGTGEITLATLVRAS